MAFGRKAPKVDTHDNAGVDYHQSYVMNGDGTRSSTWVPCRCSQASPGGNHDGPWDGNPSAPAPDSTPVTDR